MSSLCGHKRQLRGRQLDPGNSPDSTSWPSTAANRTLPCLVFFLPSVHRCLELEERVLTDSYAPAFLRKTNSALEEWAVQSGGAVIPLAQNKARQKAWDSILADQHFKSLQGMGNQFTSVRLLCAHNPQSLASCFTVRKPRHPAGRQCFACSSSTEGRR